MTCLFLPWHCKILENWDDSWWVVYKCLSNPIKWRYFLVNRKYESSLLKISLSLTKSYIFLVLARFLDGWSIEVLTWSWNRWFYLMKTFSFIHHYPKYFIWVTNLETPLKIQYNSLYTKTKWTGLHCWWFRKRVITNLLREWKCQLTAVFQWVITRVRDYFKKKCQIS